RLPLWLNRLRSKKLMDAVMSYPDFPILLETWRTCLQDEFDLENLKRLLEEIRRGEIKISEVVTQAASPFAGGLVWKQTNTYMYEDDSPLSGKASRLSQELLKEVLFSQRLRPRIPRALVETLEAKLQRTAPGYAPRSSEDLLDWIKERLLIPDPEWQELLKAIARDHGISADEAVASIREKIVSIQLPGTSVKLLCAVENLGSIARAFRMRPEALGARDVLFNKYPSGRAVMLAEPFLKKSFLETDEQKESVLSDLLVQWLSFYGPVRKSFLINILGIDEPLLDEMVAGLAESQDVLIDTLTEDAQEMEICDRENLEILLRMARRSRQPSFKSLSLDHLPLFLAAYQGLTQRGESIDGLQSALDQLFGFPAGAEAWEKHILPARVSPYYGSWLESLIQSSDLLWFGCGKRRISFAFSNDLYLFIDQGKKDGDGPDPKETVSGNGLADLLPQKIGRYSFLDIAQHSKLDSRTITNKLWDLAWQGRVSNDTFETLRRGIVTDFAPFSLKREGGRPSRSAFNRWAATRPLSGNWFAVDRESIERDPIDEAELVKDRVRQLFRRYGLIFRELLAAELPMFQWARVFKALRVMELSGEILSGYFFEGIPGVQFISHDAFRFLNEPLPDGTIYWLNATDPAALCGIKLEGLKGLLPSRLASTHLVYHGKTLVVISRRNGRVLEFLVPLDDPHILDYLTFFKILLTREFSPEKIITVETINKKPALESEYAGPLMAFGFSRYYKGLELVKRY
ncbi:MAG: ATP-dependent helicase, partial [Thermodesulfobacteriota bacterium]